MFSQGIVETFQRAPRELLESQHEARVFPEELPRGSEELRKLFEDQQTFIVHEAVDKSLKIFDC